MSSLKTRVALAVVGIALLAAGVLVARKVRQRLRAAAQWDAGAGAQAFRVAKPLDVADAAEVIYDGHLASGWSDWGWGPHDLPVAGPARITFSGYGGIILQHATLQKQVSGLSFRFKAPLAWGDFLLVSLKLSGTLDSLFHAVLVETRHTAQLPDGFREALIPWRDLNPSNAPIDRIVINAAIRVGTEPVQLDKILLVKSAASGATADASSAPQRRVEVEVLCSAEGHPISPLIYGSAGGDVESGITAERFGGNPISRHNWDLNVWNSGNDWFFENQGGLDVAQWLDTAASHHARAAITVPLIGWVAKDRTSVGFPVSKFPKQRKVDPGRNAGDGVLPDGKPITPGPPEETSVAAPPELIGQWVRALREKDRARPERALDMYILDNEPTLWDTTHRDVHPNPVTYDELLDRTIRYASEVRRVDPEAKIAGPAEWGWMGYLYSAKDRLDGKFVRSDRRAHGDVPLIAWYLKKLAQYEKEHGKRLLDVLDVHYYPAADGLYGGNARTDGDAAALRIRATRSLWDQTYVDESWINEEPIRLIPRLKEWVSTNYPGLGISIGEWSFGADSHISGALATAETLGRFGQGGLYSAFYWLGPKKGTSTFWAFRAFRNFDGAGGHFLDMSVPTRESREVSLFASRDATGSHLVTVLVNRDPVFAALATVGLASCGTVRSQRVFAYAASSQGLAEVPAEPSRTDRVALTLPPYSITVVDAQLDTSR